MCYLRRVSRERYKSYIKHTKKVFTANIEETYHSVERSKWLAGPDFLHKTVKNFGDLEGRSTKPFMQWLGVQQSLTQISGGMNCSFVGKRGTGYTLEITARITMSSKEVLFSYMYYKNKTVNISNE